MKPPVEPMKSRGLDTGGTRHQCCVCNKRFGQVGNLKRHMMIHTGERPHKCTQCDQAFITKQALMSHVSTHKNVKPHRCKQCDKVFILKSDLNHHTMKTHTMHQCSVCSKEFDFPSALRRHMIVHTKERPHKCDYCDKAFAREFDLNNHTSINHTGNKPHKCSVCCRVFGLLENLKRHMMTHTEERPHECDHCDKAFMTQSDLKRHLKIHMREGLVSQVGKKQHKCPVCNKSFLSTSDLTRHIKIHTRENGHTCSVCSKSFRRQLDLSRHMSTHPRAKANIKKLTQNKHSKPHAEEDLYADKGQCWHCGTRFQNQTNMIKHMMTHRCSICHENFCQLKYLDEHLMSHAEAYSAKYWRWDNFSNTYELLKHVKTRKPAQTGKVANCVLKVKMTWTGEVLYQCSECEKEFTDLLTASSHILSHSNKKTSQNDHSLILDDEELMIPIIVHEPDKDTDVKEDIVSQIYQHSSDCVRCVKGFLTPTDLENHILSQFMPRPII